MTAVDVVYGAQVFFLFHFMAMNGVYIVLNLVALASLKTYLDEHVLDDLPRPYSGLEPPISLLVAAFNEEATIVASVHSLLQLEYSEDEILVVNDGSDDGTLAVMIREFQMTPFPYASRGDIATAPVRAAYRSAVYPNVYLIDKENAGKADALNAAINLAQYPFFCALDADSILQRDSLRRVMEPFLTDPLMIACGGTVRIANGCRVEDGFLAAIGLPGRLLPLLQIIEYLRAFLFGRLGWCPLNAVLVISGAFGVFRRDRVTEVGGYRTDCMGEDMELVIRLHRVHRLSGRPYRIGFVPDPICWTEVPETYAVLRRQRARWQRGLTESLIHNRKLLFHRRGGAPGWIAMPFMIVFECLSPIVETAGYIFMITAFMLGALSTEALALFLFVGIAFGLLLSASSLLLEEMSFHLYPKPRHMLAMMAAVLIENLGYRQLVSLYRLIGLGQWLTDTTPEWGHMTRSGATSSVPGSASPPA
jgi:cellulose synthase/poly-beta-1,6-N-acetylglucosamine synthase-like glycosyltransferase